MPMDRRLYPKDWPTIAHQIKQASDWKCEKCGRPCRHPGESPDDFVTRIAGSEWEQGLWGRQIESPEGLISQELKLGRFVLTTAHLNHRPEDCRIENLRAWCAPCHARYDLRAMQTKQQINLERKGQLRLFPSQQTGSHR